MTADTEQQAFTEAKRILPTIHGLNRGHVQTLELTIINVEETPPNA